MCQHVCPLWAGEVISRMGSEHDINPLVMTEMRDRKQPREIIHRTGCHSSERAAELFEAGQLTISLSCTGNHPQPFSSPEVLIQMKLEILRKDYCLPSLFSLAMFLWKIWVFQMIYIMWAVSCPAVSPLRKKPYSWCEVAHLQELSRLKLCLSSPNYTY